MRSCIGCGDRRPQAELVRFVRSAAGMFVIGRTLPGRGAWVCRNTGGPTTEPVVADIDVACLKIALQRGGFQRAFKLKWSPRQVVDNLDGQLGPLVTD